ncbi:MAG: hypothetical protein WC499_00690 [Patescibacteria group bacterium]
MKFILPLKRAAIKNIVPSSKLLKRVTELSPGENGSGIAKFPKDKNHFPKRPVAKATEILQANAELGELVYWGFKKPAEKVFLGWKLSITIKEGVPQLTPFYIEVFVKKMSKESTKGKIEFKGYFDKEKKFLAVEGEFLFCVRDENNI